MSDAHRDEIAKLESLYQENPEGRLFTHLAEAYRKGGELDRAHRVLSEGIERHPDYSSAHVVLGRVLMDQDRTDEAESEFHRVLELDPHNLIAIRSLGDLARARGDDERALELYHRLLEQEPGNDDARDIVAELSAGPSAGVGTGLEAEPDRVDDAAAAGWVGGGMTDVPSTIEAEDDPFSLDPMGYLPGDDEADERPDADADDRLDTDADERPHADVAERADAGIDAGIDERSGGGADGLHDADADQYYQPPDADNDAEVRTETIAQVYARQGLYDRAAEVYRELVRGRPEDESLRDRLAEMEQLAAAQAERTGEVDAVSDYGGDEREPLPGLEWAGESAGAGVDPGDEGLDDVALEGLQSMEVDTGGAEAEALPGLEPDLLQPQLGSQDLSEELGVTDVPEPPEEAPWGGELAVEMDETDSAPEAKAAPEPTETWTDEPADEPADADAPVADRAPSGTTSPPDWLAEALAAEEPAGEEPVDEAVAEPVAEEAGEPVAERGGDVLAERGEDPLAETASAEAVWSGAEWLEEPEAENTPHAWTEEEEEEREASPPIRDYLGGLLAWSGSAGAHGAEGGHGSGPSAAGPQAGAEATAAGAGSAGGGAVEDLAGGKSAEEDDDLDMFRSWLESLKQ